MIVILKARGDDRWLSSCIIRKKYSVQPLFFPFSLALFIAFYGLFAICLFVVFLSLEYPILYAISFSVLTVQHTTILVFAVAVSTF